MGHMCKLPRDDLCKLVLQGLAPLLVRGAQLLRHGKLPCTARVSAHNVAHEHQCKLLCPVGRHKHACEIPRLCSGAVDGCLGPLFMCLDPKGTETAQARPKKN